MISPCNVNTYYFGLQGTVTSKRKMLTANVIRVDPTCQKNV